jgi:hypothetical protein
MEAGEWRFTDEELEEILAMGSYKSQVRGHDRVLRDLRRVIASLLF